MALGDDGYDWETPERLMIRRIGNRNWVYTGTRPDGKIKIGYSKAPDRRIKNLRREHPGSELIACELGGRECERRLLDSVAEHRVEGEWFHPHDDVMALVRRMSERLWKACRIVEKCDTGEWA